jgi:hypothetical protein
MKTHLATGAPAHAVCNRGRRLTDTVTYVDCGFCRNSSEYRDAMEKRNAAIEADFAAQTPRTVVPQFGRVNDDGVMECSGCGGVLWRERPRSLFSYHYVCEGCGQSVYPMTETGMCT